MLLKNLFLSLTPDQRKRFFYLQFLVVVMAFADIVGVASIIPFMSLVGDMSLLKQETLIAQIYHYSGVSTESNFVLIVGICVLIVLLISSILSMYTVWRLSMFATQVGTEIADQLYGHFLKQSWLFHASGSSALLTKKIANEATRITGQVLLPLMLMNSRVVLALFMSIAIFLYEPNVAVVGLAVFAISYFILYKIVRKRLQKNGKKISEVLEKRFRLMNEGFGGVRDVILLGRENFFITRFNQTGFTLAHSQGNNTALAQVPRYFMELIAFGSMIALVLYLLKTHNGNLAHLLPYLAVYSLAGFKLLPAFQQIYASYSQIKGNISAYESIQQDLNEYKKQNEPAIKALSPEAKKIEFKSTLQFDSVTFTYPGKSQPALNKLNLKIEANSVVGIVGSSGSGKSTIIDVLLGLIEPQYGVLKIDGNELNAQNRRSWQNMIGFVPQSIFITEGTVAENVAFGIPKDEINLDQVVKALESAQLAEVIEGLDKGIQTKVGERGVQLSGGQRQRIGIARALYHEADVLVFDEATSALDGITEKMIMESIKGFIGEKTIIMIAHRLKTVRDCDQVFLVDKGEIVDKGTYIELLNRNPSFRKMDKHA